MRSYVIILLLVLASLITACGQGSTTSSSNTSANTSVSKNVPGDSSGMPASLSELEKLPGGKNISLMSTDLNQEFEIKNNLGAAATFPITLNKKGLNYLIYRVKGITNLQQPTSFKATFTGSQSKLWFAVFNKDMNTWNWYYKSGSNTIPFQLSTNKAITFPSTLQKSFRTDTVLDKDKNVIIQEGRMYIAIVADLADGESLNITKLYVSLNNQSAFGADVTVVPDPPVINTDTKITVTGTGSINSKYDFTIDFGDGSAPLVKKGVLGGDTVTHVYTEEKTCPIKVTISDPVDAAITPVEFAKDLNVIKPASIVWTSTGGTVNGTDLNATFDTSSLAVGKYKITATKTGGNIEFASQSKAVFGPSDTKATVNLAIKDGGTTNKVDFWVFIIPQDKYGVLVSVTKAASFSDRAYSIGTDTPTKSFQDFLDKKYTITLNFWEHNCGPCLSEFPEMTQSIIDNKDKRYMHIGVTGGGLYWGGSFHTFSEVNNWLNSNGTPKYGPSWTENFYDPNTDADRNGGFAKRDSTQKYTKAATGGAISWEGNSYPRSFLIDPDGNIRAENSTMTGASWTNWMAFAKTMMPD